MRAVKRCWMAIVSVVLVTSVVLAAGPKRSKTRAMAEYWVGTWACSPQLGDPGNAPPAPGFADSTLRQIVHVSVGGRQLRIRISNAYGANELTIPGVHIARAKEGSAIFPGSDKPITFHGRLSVTIPAGALIYSDPVDFDLKPLSDLAITIRFAGVPEGITTHPGSRTTSYLQPGDAMAATEMPDAAAVEHWYYINGVDVRTEVPSSAMVALGDSITDGRNSKTNENGRWTDYLARRLQAARRTAQVAVLNQGIGGNRLLHDGLGPNALARFDRDVIAQNGVRWLILLEGINDLGTAKNARERGERAATIEDIVGAYEQIILQAHMHNIRVMGGTIMACEGSSYYTPELETARQAINRWIRTNGKLDGVVDFDAVTRDRDHPSRLSEKFDSGDHLHPGDAGYQAMANAVDLALFKP